MAIHVEHYRIGTFGDDIAEDQNPDEEHEYEPEQVQERRTLFSGFGVT
jgi:hypothetical protein